MRNPFRGETPSATPEPSPPPSLPDGGALHALEHIAAWVRFADGKASLLAAGFAASLALIGTRLDSIGMALNKGCPHNVLTIAVGGLALLAAAWTLGWLISAINPRNTVTHPGVNRFAWPSVSKVTLQKLQDHVADNEVETDAWAQAIDLARIAEKKFAATRRAGYGFAAVIVLGVALVTYTAVLAA